MLKYLSKYYIITIIKQVFYIKYFQEGSFKMNKKIKKNKKGFTLVEMIVVIAIIGVLAAMMVPSLLGYITKANTSNNKAAATQLARAVQTSLAEKNNTTITFITGQPKASPATVGLDISVTGTDTGVEADLEALYANDKFKGAFGAVVSNGAVTRVLYNLDGTVPANAAAVNGVTTSSQKQGVYPE